MEEYYFLFALAFVWLAVASFRDIKTTIVPNWLNFSLLAVALAYRAFYSSSIGDFEFLWFGILGAVFFYLIGLALYYGKVFAGGDAKLLIALGAILPFEDYNGLFVLGLGFVLLIFLVGALYVLVYSIFKALKNKKRFSKDFEKGLRKNKKWLRLSFLIGLIAFLFYKGIFGFIFGLVIFVFPLIYVYLKIIDEMMVVKRKPGDLIEGDWLIKDVKLKGNVIKKSVHGLSLKEIKLLKKHKKSVLIKQGVAFVPVFLISFLIMVFFFLTELLHFLFL